MTYDTIFHSTLNVNCKKYIVYKVALTQKQPYMIFQINDSFQGGKL